MYVPFHRIDGFRPRPRHYADYMSAAMNDLQTRTLARIRHFGVASGLEVTSATTNSVTGVHVSHGWAYDAYGQRVYQGVSGFLALNNSHDGKYVVITRTQTSGYIERHPTTGVTAYTRVADSSVLSAVTHLHAVSGHVRLALIQDVRAFPLSVLLREAPITDRDVLMASAPFPYIVVGPTGDDSADFVGDDETPFISAVNSLTSTSGGVIFAKANVYDMSGGVSVSGLTNVRIIGEGRATHLRGAAPFFRCTDLGSFEMERFAMSTSTDGGLMVTVKRVPRVRMDDCYVSGIANETAAIGALSGVDSIEVRGTAIIGNGVAPWKVYSNSPVGSIGRTMLDGCLLSGAVVQASSAIRSVVIGSNFLDDSDVELPGALPPLTSPPGHLRYAHNIHVGATEAALRTSCTGIVVEGNSFFVRDDQGSCVVLAESDSENAGFSVVDGNHFMYRGIAGCAVAQASKSASGVMIIGNTMVSDDSTATGRIGIAVRGKHAIADGNIIRDFETGLSGFSGTNWGGTTNKTSNRDL